MKSRPVIGALAIMFALTSVLSGCSRDDGKSESVYSEELSNGADSSDIIVDSSDLSDISGVIGEIDESSDSSYSHDYEESSIKVSEKVIDSEGIAFGNANETRDLYMTGMDNNYVYFCTDTFPSTIWGVDRRDFSKTEVMTYNYDVGMGDNSNNKNTYCGCYFEFPCYSTAYGGIYNMKALVGKVGEQSKCVLDITSDSMSVCVAELNDSEMVFLCSVKESNKEVYEIYKYKIGDEQAELIYTEELDKKCSPLIACCNGEIYFVYITDGVKPLLSVKRLDSKGGEIDNNVFLLPKLSRVRLQELAVTDNNIIIRFHALNAEEKPPMQAIINRKSKAVISDFGDYVLGTRCGGSLIDGRYIIFHKTNDSDFGPQFYVFDDKTSELHVISFKSLKGKYIVSAAVDYNGDVLFRIQDNFQADDTRSLVLFKDVTSLI